MLTVSRCPAHCVHAFFFFNDPPTTEIYTLSLHDALPISVAMVARGHSALQAMPAARYSSASPSMHSDMPYFEDRKSTRLNSSHLVISYAVFCLKKKKRSSPSHA